MVSKQVGIFLEYAKEAIAADRSATYREMPTILFINSLRLVGLFFITMLIFVINVERVVATIWMNKYEGQGANTPAVHVVSLVCWSIAIAVQFFIDHSRFFFYTYSTHKSLNTRLNLFSIFMPGNYDMHIARLEFNDSCGKRD